MKALRFHAARDLRVEDVPEPNGLSATEVVVAPRWTGICGTDLHEYVAGPIVTPIEPHPLTGSAIAADPRARVLRRGRRDRAAT